MSGPTDDVALVVRMDGTSIEKLAAGIARHLAGSMSSSTTPASMVYSVRSLAAELGVSDRAIRGAIHRGELAAVKRGRRYVIPGAAVAAWSEATTPARGHRAGRAVRRSVMADALDRATRAA